jgi:hypothetical protein
MRNQYSNNSKYHSGLFIPKNKDKVIKLNDKGGQIYRSSLEYKIMVWLDGKSDIVRWCSEYIVIPYQLTHFEGGDVKVKEHRYFTDFYYEMEMPDGELKKVVVEVKPHKEYQMVQDLNEGKLQIPDKGTKKLKNFEYSLKMAYQNKNKWENAIKWCNKKGYHFIIITEEHLKKMGIK